MRLKLIFSLVLLLWLLAVSPVSAQTRKVRFSVSAASIAEVPFRIAQVKGFYREEGLDVEVIMIRGAVGMQALLGGSVDYTSASGSTIAAAVRGIPVKLVFIASAKPQFDLIAQPQIRSVADLKAKASASHRAAAHRSAHSLIVRKTACSQQRRDQPRHRRTRDTGCLLNGESRRRFDPARPLTCKREGLLASPTTAIIAKLSERGIGGNEG